MKETVKSNITVNYINHELELDLEFNPYESKILKISANGEVEEMNITFEPKSPIVRPKEKQRMNF